MAAEEELDHINRTFPQPMMPMTNKTDEELLAEARMLDKLYAEAEQACSDGRAEAYDKDLRALVSAARRVADGFSYPGAGKDATALKAALDAFEPWLDSEDSQDPRENGWGR